MKDLSASAWEARYQNGSTPWDLSGPTPEFTRLAEEASWFPKRGRALVPGGGRGHDAIALARLGLETHLVDFAPSALIATQEAAAKAKVTVLTYRRDFFELPALGALQASFDLLLEYTFFCAIDPTLRPQYVDAAAKLLKPGGYLVGLFFPTSTEQAGPPFLVTQKEVEELFAPHFELVFETPKASVKPRAGREILGIFRRL